MGVYTKYEYLLKKVKLISEEIEDIRQNLLIADQKSKKGGKQAWNKLMKLSDEISARWQGPSAMEEINHQRNKSY